MRAGRYTCVALLTLGLVACSAATAEAPTRESRTVRAPMIAPGAQTAEAVVVRRMEVAAWNAEIGRQWLAAQAEIDAQAAAVRSDITPRSPGGGGGAAPNDFLACTRQRESNGQYGVVSSGGTYRGAYQFHQNTWNNTAEHAGRPDLIGADPAGASPADQDAMAQSLYEWQGTAPWGGRC